MLKRLKFSEMQTHELRACYEAPIISGDEATEEGRGNIAFNMLIKACHERAVLMKQNE